MLNDHLSNGSPGIGRSVQLFVFSPHEERSIRDNNDLKISDLVDMCGWFDKIWRNFKIKYNGFGYMCQLYPVCRMMIGGKVAKH